MDCKMKTLIPTLALVLTSLTLFAETQNKTPIETPQTYQNVLEDYSSDGCSLFPDGLPLINAKKWQKCCVVHDISYWKGGTAHERKVADQNLAKCVADTGEHFIGAGMYIGVRVGGQVDLPTTWHWGYGWQNDRGYAPLTKEELSIVDSKLSSIPKNLDDVVILSSPIVRNRKSVTGNYCLDMAAQDIYSKAGKSFQILEASESDTEMADGLIKTIAIKTDACEEALTYKFQLLKDDACDEKATNELLARGRIRMLPRTQSGCGL